VIHCEKLTKRYHEAISCSGPVGFGGTSRGNLRLLGPNGAGKRLPWYAHKQLVVRRGKAVVAGIDVVSHPALVKQVIGLCLKPIIWTAPDGLGKFYYHGLFSG